MSEDTYLQALNEIEALKLKAETLRQGELGPTIERFKKAILVYGIRPEDVFSADVLGASSDASAGVAPEAHLFGSIQAKPLSAAVLPASLGAPQANDLSPSPSPSSLRAVTSVSASTPMASSASSVSSSQPKYIDDKGNTWTGLGRKPLWFHDAIASGVSAEQMLTSNARSQRKVVSQAVNAFAAKPASDLKPAGVVKVPAVPVAPPKAHRGAVAPKYTNGKGNSERDTWSGRGRKPVWFSQAIEAGFTAESMLIGVAQADSHSTRSQGAQMMDQARLQRLAQAKAEKPPRKQGPGYHLGDKSWTGVGPRPNWFKDAVAAGMSLEQLRVN